MSQIEYELREEDLIAFEEFQLQSVERIQKVIRRHQAHVPAAIAVIALVLFFLLKDIPSAIYAILLSMAWGLGVPFYLKLNMRKQIRQMYSAEDKAKILGRYTLRAEPNALVEVSQSGETSQWPWKKVLRVEVEKKHVFVFTGLKEALIISRATLTKDSELQAFVKDVSSHIDKHS